MPQKILLNNELVHYELQKSLKARYLRITIKKDASVHVTAPYFMFHSKITSFLIQKSKWILKQIERVKNLQKDLIPMPKNQNYQKNKEEARVFIIKKIEELNKIYNFKYKRISIKDQKTRWGSCSRKGNLNFNYKLLFLPEYLAEYIVVHELCHLKELNHSKRFWDLVARAVPDYKKFRKELKSKVLL